MNTLKRLLRALFNTWTLCAAFICFWTWLRPEIIPFVLGLIFLMIGAISKLQESHCDLSKTMADNLKDLMRIEKRR